MGNESSHLPALTGDSAREQALALEPSVSAQQILDHLPDELTHFCLNRLVTTNNASQPELPGMRARSALDVSYLKLISPNVRNKMHRGKPLVDGSVVGKTPFHAPGKAGQAGFPFILLGAWIEMTYGKWLQDDGRMETYCESRDGVTPSMINDWGALKCEDCPHHPDNRPKWADDPDQDQRCKRIYNLIGVGGDWKDFYVLSIKGRSIMDLYYKMIVPHIRNMQEDNLPWYATTFMLGSVQSGNYYQFEVRNVLPTIASPSYPDDDPFWKFDKKDTNGPSVTFQLLDKLQVIANNYITERQEAARKSVQKFLATSTPVSSAVAPTTSDEEEDTSDDADGLD